MVNTKLLPGKFGQLSTKTQNKGKQLPTRTSKAHKLTEKLCRKAIQPAKEMSANKTVLGLVIIHIK